ncbi:hypothetical protein ES703_17291 [subsurface metagenome]
MTRNEALFEISRHIAMVKDSGPFEGRSKLLKTLNRLYDLVNLYKPFGNYFELCVKDAKILVNGIEVSLGG